MVRGMALKPGTVTIDRAPATLWTEAAGYQVAVVDLGANVLGEHEVPGLRWTVLADPEGDEFCVGG
jgi:hypothetical protein